MSNYYVYQTDEGFVGVTGPYQHELPWRRKGNSPKTSYRIHGRFPTLKQAAFLCKALRTSDQLDADIMAPMSKSMRRPPQSTEESLSTYVALASLLGMTPNEIQDFVIKSYQFVRNANGSQISALVEDVTGKPIVVKDD